MALETTVNETNGVEIAGSQETGSYNYITGDEPNQKLITVYYTETRTTTRYYALSKTAVDTYMTNNANKTISFDMISKASREYNMDVDEVEREITNVTIEPAPEIV